MKTIEKIKQLAGEFTTKDNGHYHYRGKECFVKGYVDGYIQCQEDNMDNKYTEEDIKKAIKLARETESVRRGALSEDWDDIEKYDEMDIIYLLNKQD